MKRLLLVTTFGLLVPSALATPEILPVTGTDYLTYDEATGKITPAIGQRHLWCMAWSATQQPWYAYPLPAGESVLDWGDIAGPANIGAFGFAHWTNSQAVDGDLWGIICFYTEENGWNSTARVFNWGFIIDNIPGSTHPPDEYWAYVWRVELFDSFVLDGSDLDEDGLVDFGYRLCFGGVSPGAVAGPVVATFDPNDAPGADEWYDLFDTCGPNDGYVGTYSLAPFQQFYWEMSSARCPNRGESGRYCSADIDGSFDCLVNLADLAECLSHYGMTSGATPLECDLDPYDPDGCDHGDGDVDLADLAELLGQYGDNCNWPQP